jgi:hypothetical protein
LFEQTLDVAAFSAAAWAHHFIFLRGIIFVHLKFSCCIGAYKRIVTPCIR